MVSLIFVEDRSIWWACDLDNQDPGNCRSLPDGVLTDEHGVATKLLLHVGVSIHASTSSIVTDPPDDFFSSFFISTLNAAGFSGMQIINDRCALAVVIQCILDEAFGRVKTGDSSNSVLTVIQLNHVWNVVGF